MEEQFEKDFAAQFETTESRFICRKCLAQYRYKLEAIEHKQLGCKIKSGKKKSASLKQDPDLAPSE